MPGSAPQNVLDHRFERLFGINRFFRWGAGRRVTRLRMAAIKNRALERGLMYSLREDLRRLSVLRQVLAGRFGENPASVAGAGRNPAVLALRIALSGHSCREYLGYASVVDRPLLYISRADLKGRIYRMVRPARRDDQPLTQKSRFSRRLAELGLPHPEFYGEVDATDPGGFRLPKRSILAKPIGGRGGSGIQIFHHDTTSGSFLLNDATRTSVSEEELFRILGSQKAGKRYVIQELLSAHPDLAGFSTGALPTARVLTGVDVHGEFTVLAAAFRMATRADVGVDNFHKGGLATAVDIPTGTLGSAISLKSPERLTHHPLSGARIEGFVLPDWGTVVTLALEAHRAFDKHRFVGWDIGITDRGPVIVEGNAQPDPDIHQRAEGRPLGLGALPTIALSWLDAKGAGAPGE